ncbi:MAG: TIGR02117 family protein [Pirellulaceae bacterium]
MNQTSSTEPVKSITGLRARCTKCVRFIVRWLCRSVLAYVIFVAIGLIPINNDFVETPDGIEVFILSNAVHTDLILPVTTSDSDWLEFFGQTLGDVETEGYTNIAIGWGDRGFFIETPTWSDFKISTAAKAVFLPSTTCLHVDFLNQNMIPAETPSVTLSVEQYRRLVAFIQSSFRLDEDGQLKRIPGEHYYTTDAFFESVGSYHLFNTCNSWAGRALKGSGVRVGLWTPIPKTIYWYLPR